MGLATHLFLLLLSAFSILQSPTLAATRASAFVTLSIKFNAGYAFFSVAAVMLGH
uniref:Uncharacterized protein n=1 Tax=Rhizophora mucronata TaxID=61149 RepID=A0A2P2IVM1_RHIMU